MYKDPCVQETLYHSTPIVGIPLGNDQKPNMMRAERRGYAVMLDWQTLDSTTFVAAINKAASDPEIKANMKRAHTLFTDEKESPQERAVWAIEYVMRHKGAQFLKPSSVSLAWYQYHLLDVFLLLLSLLTTITLTLVFCCVKCCKCLCGKRTKRKTD